MFIYVWRRERQTDRQGVSGGRAEREEDTESEAGSRIWAVSPEPDAEIKPIDHKIMTWAKVGRLTDGATQAPHDECVLKLIVVPVAQLCEILKLIEPHT